MACETHCERLEGEFKRGIYGDPSRDKYADGVSSPRSSEFKGYHLSPVQMSYKHLGKQGPERFYNEKDYNEANKDLNLQKGSAGSSAYR